MTAPLTFRTVLVANRGEIAIRVMRTLRELGIRSVAVYSEADRHARHVDFADDARFIGGNLPTESYLRGDHVIEAAVASGADAIHPGYGFLAENADFARACAAAGITWIGPSPEAIEQMGTKTSARAIMQAAGVPVVPGTVEALESFADAQVQAEAVGYPVAVKARSGGGGKGFRVALAADELRAAYDGASGEGDRYFSDPAVYLERYLHDPRHVEVQLLGDSHGTVIHLGERDCTIQRRHQKLVEESPSPAVTPELRERLAAIGIGAARAVGYTGAGTVECLLSAEGEPFFLEMNTRVQVEHTVTELVTGIDIVAEQIRIAEGHPLSITQDAVTLRGHAIECRINAEDARTDYAPSSGLITGWTEPAGIGVRVDAGVGAGSEVAPFYDSLLAKLVVVGRDREEARRRMLRALGELRIDGVRTLVDFHTMLLGRDEFIEAQTCAAIAADPAAYMPPIETSSGVVPTMGGASRRPAAPIRRTRGVIGGSASGSVTAPIPGNVLSIAVGVGDQVSAGAPLCVLEAMKMENEIAAPVNGVVEQVLVSAGDAVAAGSLLLRIAASG